MEASTLARVRAQARLAAAPLPVLAFMGQEALSEPFAFDIDTHLAYGTPLEGLIGRPLTLSWAASDGAQGTCSGIVTAVETGAEHAPGRQCARLRLEPRLSQAKQARHTRVFRGVSLPELVQSLVGEYGYRGESLSLRLARAYPARPYTLQAQESDFDFLTRLLAGAGIFYWFESVHGQDRLCLSDSNSRCDYLPGTLVYHAPGGTAAGGLDELRQKGRHLATGFAHHYQPSPPPARPRALGEGDRAVRFAAPQPSADGAEQLARLAAERAAAHSWRLHAAGDQLGLRAGAQVSLSGRRRRDDLSGDYLLVRVAHTLHADGRYRAAAELIRRHTPYRPPLPAPLELPLLFPARIESAGRYAGLDGAGHTRARLGADELNHPLAEASPPLPQLQPYGGRPGAKPSGWHFPLQAGAEVLITCLNGDPDRPLVVGFAPSRAQPGPVTADNPSEHRLHTPGRNTLLLDDRLEQAKIVLQTFDGHTVLALDADAEHPLAKLASRLGALQLYAAKNQQLHAAEALTERVGGERTQLIEANSRTRTESAEIHHQSAADASLRAGANARISAGGDTQLVSAERLKVRAAQGVSVTVHGANGLVAHIRDGDVHVQAANAIRLTGQGGGDIVFEQGGGGFAVKADGSVRLFGNTVSLKSGSDVALNGPVEYSLPGGNAPEKVKVRPALAPAALEELGLEGFEAEALHQELAIRLLRPEEIEGDLTFTLKSASGEYSQSLSIGDGQEDSDGHLELVFTDLDPADLYNLEVAGAGGDYTLFRDATIQQILRGVGNERAS